MTAVRDAVIESASQKHKSTQFRVWFVGLLASSCCQLTETYLEFKVQRAYICVLVSESGCVYSFGANGEGQLGLGGETDGTVTSPRLVEALQDKSVQMLSAGADHCIALTGTACAVAAGESFAPGMAVSKAFRESVRQVALIRNSLSRLCLDRNW